MLKGTCIFSYYKQNGSRLHSQHANTASMFTFFLLNIFHVVLLPKLPSTYMMVVLERQERGIQKCMQTVYIV